MSSSTKNQSNCDENGLKKGPWTVEEDTLLIHSIALHGEGRWNLLALRSGLRRTGKSCRLRWLNYLKPEVKRGNLSPQEQILILDLHLRWGNRWSKIAQELPGRTDNEIKNYWRTRVQKQAKLLNIDTNTQQFKDIVRCFWIPRLLQQINESPSSSSSSTRSQVPADEKNCHFSSEKQEENLDPDQSYCISQISSESIMDISRGYDHDPFSGDPFLSAPPPEFDYSISGWMDNYSSDAGYVWNLDELWQF